MASPQKTSPQKTTERFQNNLKKNKKDAAVCIEICCHCSFLYTSKVIHFVLYFYSGLAAVDPVYVQDDVSERRLYSYTNAKGYRMVKSTC